MTDHFSDRLRWLIVAAFAIAMAWVEAASVFYIRALVDRIEPYQANPLPINEALSNVELWREASTLVMIAALGLLAGRTWRRRAGYAALAFGIWDICYYVFLRLISGWPRTLLDWDVLFLLPLPWWGPVLAPAGASRKVTIANARPMHESLEKAARAVILQIWDRIPDTLPRPMSMSHHERRGALTPFSVPIRFTAIMNVPLAIPFPTITFSHSGSVSKSGWSGSEPIAVG